MLQSGRDEGSCAGQGGEESQGGEVMTKPRWNYEEVIGGRRVYARMGRAEIVVRVERDGDTTQYAEWGYPKVLGVILAAKQAAAEVPDEDIRV
jgi:hypothetical protein